MIVSEIGVDMSKFETADHLAAWAGLAPGNNESAGKRLSGKTRRGNKALGVALNQAAHAVAHMKNTYLSAQYHRLAGRRGQKKAIVAVAHSIHATRDRNCPVAENVITLAVSFHFGLYQV